MRRLARLTILLSLGGILGFSAAAPAVEDTWVYKRDMPTARTWASGCALDGKIYVIGGARSDSSVVSAVEAYDPRTDSWTKMADLPAARCYHATCAFNGKIYVFGGSPGTVWSSADRSVFLYDPQTNTWTRKADMPYAVGSCGIAMVDHTIYLVGGTTNVSAPPFGTVMAYDPATDQWTRKADMPTAREGLDVCAVAGKIYALGGCKQDWQVAAFKDVEVYDPAGNTWARKQDMPTARWSLGACVVDGKIYAVGGNLAMQALTVNELYDPATDTWTTKSSMQQRRLGHVVESLGARIYAIGGHYPNLTVVSKAEEYDTGLAVVPSPDFNGDGLVDIQDLLRLIESWGRDDPTVDIAPPPFGDNVVDRKDLEVLMSYWGQEIPDPALIAHWKLDEAAGLLATDQLGIHHGTLLGNPTWQPNGGKIKGALLFDGVDDYVATPAVLDASQQPLSIFVWVKGGAPGQVLFSQAPGANWLAVSPAGALKTDLTQTGRLGKPLVSSAVITDGAWHRVGLTWDGAQRILYVDGAEVTRDTQSTLPVSIGTLTIGAGTTLAPGTFWSGLIDDVRIYDRVVKP